MNNHPISQAEEEYRCPLSAVDRRLDDVHRYWHEAERGYFDPEQFRVSIQTSIQTLRTVTFILQSNKRLFNNFEHWYTPWQEKMRADSLMRWMVDARNKIEKQGDLEAHSFIRAEIVASYYEDGPRMDVPADLFQNPAQLISNISTEALIKHIFKDGILRIQRRWVENSLPDYELLEAVGIAYGRVAELVADAHRELGLKPPATMAGDIDRSLGRESRGGRLPCMIGHDDIRSCNIWLATGHEVEVKQVEVKFDRKPEEKVTNKYDVNPEEVFQSNDSSPSTVLHNLFTVARNIFLTDGYHEMMAFMLNGSHPINLINLRIEEHGEKYLVMRTLAHEVIRNGADGLILIGEIWTTVFDPENPYRRAVDAPNKCEYLSATLVSKTEAPIQLLAKINRREHEVILSETFSLVDQAQIAFAPIYAAWGREIPKAWTDITEVGARDSSGEILP